MNIFHYITCTRQCWLYGVRCSYRIYLHASALCGTTHATRCLCALRVSRPRVRVALCVHVRISCHEDAGLRSCRVRICVRRLAFPLSRALLASARRSVRQQRNRRRVHHDEPCAAERLARCQPCAVIRHLVSPKRRFEIPRIDDRPRSDLEPGYVVYQRTIAIIGNRETIRSPRRSGLHPR